MEPSGKVLGQLAVLQSMASLMPNLATMLSFVKRGLLDVPGIVSVEHTLPENSTSRPEPAPPAPNMLKLHVSSKGWLYADLILGIGDFNAFSDYKPFVENMCGMLGLILEERRQRELHQTLSQELEERVKTRTKELREKEEHLRITLDSIGDGVISTDTNGRVTGINPVAQALTGWTAADAVGRPMTEVMNMVNEMTRAPVVNPVEKVLQSGVIVGLANHTVLISRNGSERQIADSAAPIRDSSGELHGVVLVFRDVTEQYQLMEAVQRSQKLEALGVLAGGIAHDFNNLLAGIFGNIELALDDLTHPGAAQCLETAVNTMSRARALTHQLLTFAKGGAPVKQVQRLNSFIEDAAKFAASGSNVALKIDMPDDLWACNFDKNQIGQVIDNVVINAKQAMPLGGVIRVKAENTAVDDAKNQVLKPGPYVKLTISDTGIGIPANILPRIFDPFFTTKSHGHGLGLATCYSIISKHGGHILAESEQGKGTSFIIYLPAADEDASSEAAKVLSSSAHSGEGTVLIMDDQDFIRKHLSMVLSSMGYSTAAFSNGDDAVSWLRKAVGDGCSVKAAILDLTVPGGAGGIQAVKEIREISSSIPVFVSSGYSIDPVMANPAQYGFTDSISKPFQKADLANLLNRHLGSYAPSLSSSR